MLNFGLQEKIFLENMASLNFPEFSEGTPQEARKIASHMISKNEVKKKIFKIENFNISKNSLNFNVRVYWPSDEKNLPALLYFHGGGYVFGTLDHVDNICRKISKNTNHIVISVDYSLAPELKFPTQINEGVLALEWIVKNSDKLNLDINRISISGDSAGGNLATVTTLIYSENITNPKIKSLILIYPVLDFNCCSSTYDKYETGLNLTKKDMLWFRENYLEDISLVNDWKISPIYSDNLSNLPKTLIISAGLDPLQEEGYLFYEKLLNQNVKAEIEIYHQTIHGFLWFENILDSGKDALNKISQFLQKI